MADKQLLFLDSGMSTAKTHAKRMKCLAVMEFDAPWQVLITSSSLLPEGEQERWPTEVGAFNSTVLAPVIVNSAQEEERSTSAKTSCGILPLREPYSIIASNFK
jgi:hypothetical protein